MKTINHLMLRILKSNIKKYVLFIGCNTSAIGMLFSCTSLMFNNGLQNNQIVDPIISSNIYAPTVLLMIFLAFFIPYTQLIFQKQIQKDYGILISLGMLESEVRYCVFVENAVLVICSILGGIFLGNVLSLILFLIIKEGIGISGITFENSLSLYLFTVGYTFVLFFISFVMGWIRILKSSIFQMLLAHRESEETKSQSSLFFVGLCLVILSFIILFSMFKQSSNISIFCFGICIIGIVLMCFNCRFLLEKGKKKYLFLISDWLYYFRRNSRIFILAFLLYFAVLFFNMFALVTYPNFIGNALAYHPFHMTFSEFANMEWIPSEELISEMAEREGIQVTEYGKIPYLYVNQITVFCIDDINARLNKNYKVETGEYIYVFNLVENDGYEYDLNSHPRVLKLQKGTEELELKEAVVDILFGREGGITDNVILVNKNTYKTLCVDGSAKKHYLHIYTFSDWKKSLSIVDKLKREMLIQNHWNEESIVDIASVAIAYANARKSSFYLIFLIGYITILFLFSIFVTIHFKLGMEYEEERYKIWLLKSIGVLSEDLKQIVRVKIQSIFFFPLYLAIIVMLLYSVGTNITYGYEQIGLLLGWVVSIVVVLIMNIVVMCYVNYFHKKIIKRILYNVNFSQN